MVTSKRYVLVLLLVTWISWSNACVPGCQCTMVRAAKKQKGRKVDCTQHVAPFKTLSNLNFPPDTVHLDLAHNTLTVIRQGSFIQLSSLQKLNLSSNHITYIEHGAFDGLQSLKKLDLSNNAIGALNSHMFTGLPKLEKLFLSSNRISVIPDGTFSDLRSMKRIEFSSEFLRCDCNLKWILKWAKQQHVRIPGSTVCALPVEMRGRPLSRLKQGDLHCDHNLQLHIFEIRPSESQLVFIGDKLPFECHASVTSQDKMNISWYRGDRIVTSNKTLGIYVNTSHNHDHTITNHRLVVDSLEPSHAGDWSCVVSSDKGNLTKTVHVEVRAPEVGLECPLVTNRTSKGVYVWQESMAGLTVTQPCQRGDKGAVATHKCEVDGRWRNLNVSSCSFIKNITRRLSKFAKLDIATSDITTATNGINKALMMIDDSKEALDSFDVFYLAKISSNLLSHAASDPMVSSLVLNMVSNVSILPSEVIDMAQFESRAPARMVKMLEQLSDQVKMNTAVEWTKVSDNILVVVFNRKHVLQNGLSCGLQQPLHYGFTSSSLLCGNVSFSFGVHIHIPDQFSKKLQTSAPQTTVLTTTGLPVNDNLTYSFEGALNNTALENLTVFLLPSSNMSFYDHHGLVNSTNTDSATVDSSTTVSPLFSFPWSASQLGALNISSKFLSRFSKPLNLTSRNLLSSWSTDLNFSTKHLFPFANNVNSPSIFPHVVFKANVYIIVYRTGRLFPVIRSDSSDPVFRKGHWVIVTPVIAISLGGSSRNLSQPVVITFEIKDTKKPIKAAYFDFDFIDGYGGWRTDGCEIVQRNGTIVVVHVYHLSNFALLQDRSFAYRLAAFSMEPVIYVGSGLCMLCMIVIIISFMACYSSIGIPKKIKHAVVNICISTLLMMAAFIFGINRTDFELPCQIAGICIHYLTLCTVFWITITSNIIYKKFIKVNKPAEPPPELGPMPLPPKPILQFYFVGYGVPLIICGITAAVNLNFYTGHKYCFLEWEPSLGAFYAPVALLVAWNLVLFMRISCVVRVNSETDSEAANESENEIHTNEIELVPSQPDTVITTSRSNHTHHVNNNITSSNGGGYRRRFSRASNDEDEEEEDAVSVTSIPDQERRPITQLRSLVAILFLFIVMWMSGALATAKPFHLIIPFQEIIFSYIYGLMSTLFGIFMIVYFIVTRNDTRMSWKRVAGCVPPEPVTTEMEVTETTTEPAPPPPPVQPQANGSIIKSNSNTNLSVYSQKSSNLTKAYNMKNNSKQSNINLIIPNSSEISFGSAQEGFPNFYNPRQNGAAKKFWQKNRHHSKVMNKDVNRDLNSSLTDNNSATETSQGHLSHGTSSDANTHLSIEIQFQTKNNPAPKTGSFSSSREIPVHINNPNITNTQNILGSSCGAISIEHNNQVSGVRTSSPDMEHNSSSAFRQSNSVESNSNLPQHQRSPSAGSIGAGVHPSAFTPVQPRNNNTLPRHGKNLDEETVAVKQGDKESSMQRNQLSGTNTLMERQAGDVPQRPVNPGVAWNPFYNLPPLPSHPATYSFTPPPSIHPQQQHYPFDYSVYPSSGPMNTHLLNASQAAVSSSNSLSPTSFNQQSSHPQPPFNIPPSPYFVQAQGRQVKSMSPGSSSSQSNKKCHSSANGWRPLSGGDSSDSSRPRQKRAQVGGSPGRTVTYAPCSPVMSDSQAYNSNCKDQNQNNQQNMKKARSVDSDHHSDPTHRKKHSRADRMAKNKLTNKQRSLGWDEQFKDRPAKINYVYVNHMYRDKVMHKLIKQASESDDLASKAFWLPRSASEYERLTQKGFCNMTDDSSTSSDDDDSLDDNVWIRQSSGSDFHKKETSV
ncbi:uncharacterized protein LOC106070481 isoform X2 [Biomphalaria glabrata]|uniref:Uncharacterized protein LOC106070481 isoform X2 n=1 Tax=Biomphalaria glabrata TaxID=6526 RepID=A0A9W3AVT5_BIOGL|nr:uncharacterized protein LOC106070481 isoform X2 [Biomphalaria glabrata]